VRHFDPLAVPFDRDLFFRAAATMVSFPMDAYRYMSRRTIDGTYHHTYATLIDEIGYVLDVTCWKTMHICTVVKNVDGCLDVDDLSQPFSPDDTN
jgi:hypothetical protein